MQVARALKFQDLRTLGLWPGVQIACICYALPERSKIGKLPPAGNLPGSGTVSRNLGDLTPCAPGPGH